MKKRFLAYLAAGFAALSCGSLGTVQTVTYDDGLYYRPAPAKEVVVVETEPVDNILAETKSSPAYILSAGDTLVVNPGQTVRFSNNGRLLTVVETPSLTWNTIFTYSPWPYYHFAWDPWYWDRWYWDDPWFYGPWRY
nr:hypothetical protein [Bacteroidales bacterium]